MSEIALIAKARQSKTSPTGQPCNSCPSVGMPILPVRLAIVPKSVRGVVVPAHAYEPALAEAEIGKLGVNASRYALRTLRPGFLYLYYPLAGKAWTWRCIMISPSGALREIPLASSPDISPTDPKCGSASHAVNASLISIADPEKVATAYIAYSEHFWTEKTRNQNAKLLGSRMRKFSPAQWWASQDQANCLKPDQIEKTVLEYNSVDFARDLTDDYFEYAPRKDMATNIYQRMNTIAPGKGMVLVVPDPIGCISSLNSLRVHALNRLRDYIQHPDIAWKHSTAIQIQGLRDYVQEQAKAQIKTPQYAGRGHTMVKTREQRIKEEVNKGWARFEEHYSESARTKFLEDYNAKCAGFQKEITALDKDYSLWLASETYKLAKADYDRSNVHVGCLGSALDACVLAGGVVSEYSLKAWTDMLQRKADNLQNYAIMGMLANQEKWAKAFKSADEKSVSDFVLDIGTLGKEYDMARNTAESDKFSTRTNDFLKKTNQYIGELLQTIVGAVGAITADAVRRGLSMNDAWLKSLSDMQAKLGLVHAKVYTEVDAVLLKIELTIDEWQQIAKGYMRSAPAGAKMQKSGAVVAMALAVHLQVPAGSAAAQKLVPFFCWIFGTSAQIAQEIKSLGAVAVDAGAAMASKGARAVGVVVKAGATAAIAPARGAARAVHVVGHSLARGSKLIASIPSHISATAAAKQAMQITRNSMTIAGTTDVRLASVAACFQAYGLYNAYGEFQKNVGWKQADAVWAMGSSVMGLLGASMDLYTKSVVAIKGQNAAVRVLGVKMLAQTALRVGGLLGAAASLVDVAQSVMKAHTFAKRGDKDAALYVGLGAFVSVGAAIAGYKIALGSAALFGPVGFLILCIGAGLVLAYLAFTAEDTPIGIWLDRCIFGKGQRAEGKFPTQRHEADALEMVGKQLVIQAEWHDTMTSLDTDEISITIKRPANTKDAVALGVRFHAQASQEDRRSYSYLHGTSSKQLGTVPLPSEFYKLPMINTQSGSSFDAQGLFSEREFKVTQEDGVGLYLWEERLVVNSDKFTNATVYVRYFPDKSNPDDYLDQKFKLAD